MSPQFERVALDALTVDLSLNELAGCKAYVDAMFTGELSEGVRRNVGQFKIPAADANGSVVVDHRH